jgi:hypothetical protein
MAAYNAITNKPFAQSVHPKYYGSGLSGKLFGVSTALTLAPDHGTYFNMALPANEILIKSLTVKTSSPEAKTKIMLFNREQKYIKRSLRKPWI